MSCGSGCAKCRMHAQIQPLSGDRAWVGMAHDLGSWSGSAADLIDRTSIMGELRDGHDVFGLVDLCRSASSSRRFTALLHLAGRRALDAA